MTLEDLHTPDAVAGMLGKSRGYVMERAAKGEWPHLRIGRTVRFTDEHVSQILHLLEQTPRQPAEQPPDPWGRVRRGSR
ncbi:putative DNA binding domain, excisionase family [Nostocoides japonicum T1-X7]|uniref:Putative DNA binding domain, excisionase family n=1 Tax=Nostocoides japonicum T1-X7 TaxID=1194083 RepID=A0A077M0L3_9MICO|nr:hypothetical protein [Tetrasphaera japonica]CCH77750.1 putative DNA binding domain, excisionase family [Tetrasphaera japonica T1-X7]